MAEAVEREVNARLRRVDWRFLLPSPRPARVLCLAGPVLTAAVASIAGEVVTDGTTGDCDLAVAEDPDPLVLARLYQGVRPGGSCYTEWHVSVGGTRRIERTLKAAGFSEVACYRPWPGSAALPVYWIPIGASGPSSYVRSRRWLRGGRVRRILAGAAGTARVLAKGRATSRICAIARRPGGASARGTDPAGWLSDSWSAWGLGRGPERLSTLLVTGGPRSVSKVVLLAFPEGRSAPQVAIKAPRVEEAASGVRREGAALARLAADHGGPIPGVPRLLEVREVDGVPLVAESALPGRPLESLLAPANLRAWSATVADWLARLAAGRPVAPAASVRERLVEPLLGRFAGLFGRVVDPGLLRESEEIVRAVGALPQVSEQRDFGPWNVLVTPGGELAVLDWESAEMDGLPVLDLLYYLAYASFGVDRARDTRSRVGSYRRLLDPRTRTGGVHRDCVARYVEATGLAGVPLAPLRVLLWLIHAPSEFRHAAADAGGPPPDDVLARSLFLRLWQEEVRRASRG
jgi:hypothetical protein